jgi:adenylosuccinate lyase
MDGLDVYPERMRRNLDRAGGLVCSGRVLLALVEKGLGRQEAYELVQGYAKQVWDDSGDFRALLAADPRVRSVLSEGELAELFDYEYHLREIDTTFARLGLEEASVASGQVPAATRDGR